MKWYCPVCGYDLTEYAADRVREFDTVYDTGFVLYTTICPCCGIQFGIGDVGNKSTYETDKNFYINLRKDWIAGGMKWKHDHADDPFPENHPPQNWNPSEQLKNISPEFLGEDEKY